MLPAKSLKYLEKLYTSFQSPFREIVQTTYDRTFEAGIRQFWQNQLKPQDYVKRTRDFEFLSEEQYLLLLSDLDGLFLALIIGLMISFTVFGFEMNWKRIRAIKFQCSFSFFVKQYEILRIRWGK